MFLLAKIVASSSPWGMEYLCLYRLCFALVAGPRFGSDPVKHIISITLTRSIALCPFGFGFIHRLPCDAVQMIFLSTIRCEEGAEREDLAGSHPFTYVFESTETSDYPRQVPSVSSCFIVSQEHVIGSHLNARIPGALQNKKWKLQL